MKNSLLFVYDFRFRSIGKTNNWPRQILPTYLVKITRKGQSLMPSDFDSQATSSKSEEVNNCGIPRYLTELRDFNVKSWEENYEKVYNEMPDGYKELSVYSLEKNLSDESKKQEEIPCSLKCQSESDSDSDCIIVTVEESKFKNSIRKESTENLEETNEYFIKNLNEAERGVFARPGEIIGISPFFTPENNDDLYQNSTDNCNGFESKISNGNHHLDHSNKKIPENTDLNKTTIITNIKNGNNAEDQDDSRNTDDIFSCRNQSLPQNICVNGNQENHNPVDDIWFSSQMTETKKEEIAVSAGQDDYNEESLVKNLDAESSKSMTKNCPSSNLKTQMKNHNNILKTVNLSLFDEKKLQDKNLLRKDIQSSPPRVEINLIDDGSSEEDLMVSEQNLNSNNIDPDANEKLRDTVEKIFNETSKN